MSMSTPSIRPRRSACHSDKYTKIRVHSTLVPHLLIQCVVANTANQHIHLPKQAIAVIKERKMLQHGPLHAHNPGQTILDTSLTAFRSNDKHTLMSAAFLRSAARASSRSARRATKVRFAPEAAKSIAAARPIPLFA